MKASLATKDPAEARDAAVAARAELDGQARRLEPEEVNALAAEWYRDAVAKAQDPALTAADWDNYLDCSAGLLPIDPDDPYKDVFEPDKQLLQDAEAMLRAKGFPADRDTRAHPVRPAPLTTCQV